MAYSRIRTLIEVSDYSDYSNATVMQTEVLNTAILVPRVSASMTIPTAGITLTLSGAATAWSALHIKNTDSTNYVTIAYTSVGAAGAATVRVLAGKSVTLTSDINHSGNITLTANTAACICDVTSLES